MKRILSIILALVMTLLLCGCSATCHYCGDPIDGDPVEAGGRTYCSHDCYMNELLGVKIVKQ